MNDKTMLEQMYRCKIEPTGEILQRIQEFKLPMNPHETITYSREREMAILMPEPELKQFLHDFDNWAEMLQVCKEHPHIQTEYQQLMVLVKLLS
jgi:hypothetical protein